MISRVFILLFPLLNISLSYGCEQCSSIADNLSNIANNIPTYRNAITEAFQNFSSENPFLITFFRNASASCQAIDGELNKITTCSLPTPFEDKGGCYVGSINTALQEISTSFQNIPSDPPMPENSEEIFSCEDLPLLLERIAPSNAYIKNINKLCSEICIKDDDNDYNAHFSNAILFLSNYQAFSQTLFNSFSNAFCILEDIAQKNMEALSDPQNSQEDSIPTVKSFGFCWSCNEENLQKTCLTIQTHYDELSNILTRTLQRLQTFPPPLHLETTTQIFLVNQKGQDLAMIPEDPQRRYFIFENDQFFFPTTEKWWNIETNAEELKEILIPVTVDSISKRITAPSMFKDAPAPCRIYIALKDLTNDINDNLDVTSRITKAATESFLPSAS